MKKYNEIELQEVVKKSSTYREVLHVFERNESGASYKTLHRRLKEWNIDTSHFLNRSELMKLNYDAGTVFTRKTNEELFTVNEVSRNTIKQRIISEKLIEYKCKFCGQDENWFGKEISLILDHINGVNNDNRLENLRILCPNCNATLDTHCKGACGLVLKIKKLRISPPRLNQRKVKERPSLDELNEMLKTMSYRAIGRKYNVSDNAIRRWMKLYQK